MRGWRYVKHELVFAALLILLIVVACLVGCGDNMCGCPFGMICTVGRDGKPACEPAPRQVANSDEAVQP